MSSCDAFRPGTARKQNYRSGALAILGLEGDSGVERMLDEVAAGRTRGLIVCDWDAAVLGERGARALAAAEWILFVGPRASSVADHADLVFPTCVHVERDGTFTNHAGRVQRFWRNVSAHEASRPAWQALAAKRYDEAVKAFADRIRSYIEGKTGFAAPLPEAA